MTVFVGMLLWLILSTGLVLGDSSINEIMYNPGGNDNHREFVEIISDSIQNLSGFMIGDSSSNDTLIQAFFSPSSYSLIVEEDFDYTGINASIYSIGSTIGNNLNDEDTLSFYSPNGTLLDQVTYSSSWGGKDNNKSLERRKDGTFGESRADGGTPGRLNSLANTSLDFAALKISEILANPHDEDNELKPLGEWIELQNLGQDELFLGGLYFQDAAGGRLYITDDKVLGPQGIFFPPHSFLVVYRNGDADFSLNNQGPESVSLLTADGKSIDQRSYTGTTEGMSWSVIQENIFLTLPTEGTANEFTEGCDWFLLLNLSESISRPEDFSFSLSINRFFGFENRNITVRGKIEDVNGRIVTEYAPYTNDPIASYSSRRFSPRLPEGVYQVSFWIEDLECDDVDPSDNMITRLIAINTQHRVFESTLVIEKVSGVGSKTIQWGEAILAEISAYKGNTSKRALQAWVEWKGKKVSPVTSASLSDQFTDYHFTIPLQLYPRCLEEEDTSELTFHLSGLGLEATKGFTVTGSDPKTCSEIKDNAEETGFPTKSSMQYLILDSPSQSSPNQEFPVRVQILNEDKPHLFTIWAYAYRGSKCYSCRESQEERDHLRRDISLASREEKVVEIPLFLDPEMEEGEYRIKVSIVKDNRKTSTDLTSTFRIVSSAQSRETSLPLTAGHSPVESSSLPVTERSAFPYSSGVIVYESNSAKAKRLIPISLALSFGLLCITLAWRSRS